MTPSYRANTELRGVSVFKIVKSVSNLVGESAVLLQIRQPNSKPTDIPISDNGVGYGLCKADECIISS